MDNIYHGTTPAFHVVHTVALINIRPGHLNGQIKTNITMDGVLISLTF